MEAHTLYLKAVASGKRSRGSHYRKIALLRKAAELDQTYAQWDGTSANPRDGRWGCSRTTARRSSDCTGGAGLRPAHFSLIDHIFHLKPVFHKIHWTQNRIGHPRSPKMLFDLPFAIEMGDAGILVRAAYRAVNEMADVRGVCGVAQRSMSRETDAT